MTSFATGWTRRKIPIWMGAGYAKRTAPEGRPFSALGDEVDYAAMVDGVTAEAGLRAPTVFTGRGSALRAAANSALA